MRKAEMEAKIQDMKAAMSPLALKWAKIPPKKWDKRFDTTDFTHQELTDRYKSVKALFEGAYADLAKVWKALPESQWEMTFAQGMKHMPEYQDLRRELVNFRDTFLGRAKADA